MASVKPRGGQLNIQSISSDISADPTSIGSIATGLTTDAGAKSTLDANYSRVDGTNAMTADLNMGSNNIVSVGTVDGRDVSVDGATLDSHVADATVHRTINDAGTGTTDLWSADKITTELTLKADKVTGATAGNFAGLDAAGNLTDSTFNSASFATAAQGSLADTAVQPGDNVSVLTNDAGYTTDANVATNHYTKSENDGTAGTPGAKIDKVASATAGNVATLLATGNIQDSGTALSSLAPLNNPTFTGVPVLPTYTLATLPTAVAGGVIYVSDANAGSGALAYSDGTNWLDAGTHAVVA